MAVAVISTASRAGQVEITGNGLSGEDSRLDLVGLPVYSRANFYSDIRSGAIDDDNSLLALPLERYLSVIYNPGRVQSLMVVRLARFMRDELSIHKGEVPQFISVASAIVDNLNGIGRAEGVPTLKIEDLAAGLISLRGRELQDPVSVLEHLLNIRILRSAMREESSGPKNLPPCVDPFDPSGIDMPRVDILVPA